MVHSISLREMKTRKSEDAGLFLSGVVIGLVCLSGKRSKLVMDKYFCLSYSNMLKA